MGTQHWLEGVPNISEGRRRDVLDALKAAATVAGCHVLSVDADADHNRSVFTVVGPPAPLVEAMYQISRVAVEHIDLRGHRGTHPRIGAVDVIPFVPIRGTPMAVAIDAARRLGERLAHAFNLPVFLYGHAAQRPERVNLADVRRGEFEGLAERLIKCPPDFGPSVPHPSAGAVAVGARRPLVAFNAYLNTQDIALARRIARAVRGSSGGLVGVKALAMDTKRQGRVQVSMNVVDYPLTALPRALEMVRLEASRLGVSVTETELVGMLPMAAVEDVVRYYLGLAGFDRGRILEYALFGALHPDQVD